MGKRDILAQSDDIDVSAKFPLLFPRVSEVGHVIFLAQNDDSAKFLLLFTRVSEVGHVILFARSDVSGFGIVHRSACVI